MRACSLQRIDFRRRVHPQQEGICNVQHRRYVKSEDAHKEQLQLQEMQALLQAPLLAARAQPAVHAAGATATSGSNG
jgi:hypothetical protein